MKLKQAIEIILTMAEEHAEQIQREVTKTDTKDLPQFQAIATVDLALRNDVFDRIDVDPAAPEF